MSPDEHPAPTDLSFLIGAGELGTLIASHDWRATPLGPLAGWPRSLRTSVSLMLNSRHPMWIGWGPQATFLYNDAYVSVLGAPKHPWALGRPAAEVWAEIWDVCGPLADKVFARGEATVVDDVQLFMARGAGVVEETYYSFSYSPIRDETGGVGGLFCPSTETTARNLNARRLATLSELAAQSLAQPTADAACRSAAAIFAGNPADLPFALIYLDAPGAGEARLEQAVGLAPDGPWSPRAIATGEASTGAAPAWPLTHVLTSGRAEEVALAAPEDFPRGLAERPLTAALALPIAQPGQERPVGVLVAGLNPTRRLDDEYRTFLALAAGQLGTAIQHAHAAEEQRRRAEALAALDRAKTTFFSNVSHEFRTPLTLILGPLQDVLTEPGPALPAAQRQRIEVARRNALRLQKLVNTLLDVSRIEAGRTQARVVPADLATLTLELVEGFRPAIERAGLAFEVDCPPLAEPVWVDVAMWEKMVLNLLSNALKFTFEGRIALTLAAEPDEARRGGLPERDEREDEDDHGPATRSTIALSVADTGVGIPPEELPRVFDRFHRIEGTRARTHEGSGIGLALVRDLVQLHGGRIDVTSEPGRGSCFTIRLPRGGDHLPAVTRQAAAAGEGLEGPPAVGGTGAGRSAGIEAYVAEAERWQPAATEELATAEGMAPPEDAPSLLVVDDNADMRDHVASLLRSRWRVRLAGHGEEALARIAESPPDLVVSDVMMPGLDGFGLLQRLRAAPATADIPVVLVSARAGEEARVEALQAGADDYLVKPFLGRELIARLDSQLLRARVRSAEKQQARETAVANRAKDEFLALLGHELRNPLAPILTATQLMRLRRVPGIEREIGMIERQAQHLVRLVDDLLDVSRVAEGKVQLQREPLEVAALIPRAVEVASPLLEERGHRLDIDVPETGLVVNVDAARFTQIVANLVANAAKYTEPGGHLAIAARAVGREAVIDVSDDGIGISAAMLPHVFERFVQERQALDRSRGGLGLGLAIVRSLTELHGGEVRAHSDGPGRGSRFELRFPLAVPEATRPAPAAPGGAQAAGPGGLRILVVDDNRDAALLLAELLGLAGHRCEVAHDGPSALALAARFGPEVALLDIGLPGMDGYELAGRLREAAAPGSPRLIAVSGYGLRADLARSAAAGFEQHLVKPVDADRLRALLAGPRADADAHTANAERPQGAQSP